MNLLIVDDQKAVTDSLQQKLDLKKTGISAIYTANSAREAKLILAGFAIDILLTDIEMPEEDGLSLFGWAMEKYPDVVGVFLTSHAEFSYARDALKLGGFDYVLQPARIEEVEETLARAVSERKKRLKETALQRAGAYVSSQRDVVLELLLVNARSESSPKCESLFENLLSMFGTQIRNCVLWNAQVRILPSSKSRNDWDTELLKLVLRNVLEELLAPYGAMVIIAREAMDSFRMIAGADEERMQQKNWAEVLETFAGFFNARMDFKLAVFPNRFFARSFSARDFVIREGRDPGVFWEEPDAEDSAAEEIAERVRKAEAFIRENLYRSISRTEVAEYLHINEDYFTRIFKKYTGLTFKDYDSRARMETAKTLLEQTRLPVGIIATKVGYDNFSHFSKAFKKYTGKTPTEFR